MNKTRRTIGLSALVILMVLGTGWALEKAASNAHRQGGAAVSEPAKANDAVTAPSSQEPKDEQPPRPTTGLISSSARGSR
jgi:hypothetical protein